jgi:hypothetical protein
MLRFRVANPPAKFRFPDQHLAHLAAGMIFRLSFIGNVVAAGSLLNPETAVLVY